MNEAVITPLPGFAPRKVSPPLQAITDALGTRWGSSESQALAASLGPAHKKEVVRRRFKTTMRYSTFGGAVTYVMNHEGVITGVIVNTQVSASNTQVFTGPGLLVPGLSDNASREEVLAKFGKPVNFFTKGDQFNLGGNHLIFVYDNEGAVQQVAVLT